MSENFTNIPSNYSASKVTAGSESFEKPFDQLKAWAILIVIGLIWGSTFSLAKIGAEGGGHPIGIAFWQTIIGASVLSFLVLIRRQKIPFTPRHILFYVVCGLSGTVIPNSLFYYAAPHISPGVLSITVTTVPMMTFVVAALLRIEAAQLRRVIGVCLGMGAVALLVGPETSLPDPAMIPWIFVGLVAAACYTVENLVVATKMPVGISPLVVATGMYISSAIIFTPVVFSGGTFHEILWPLSKPDLAIVVMSGISVLAYASYVYLITKAGAVFASQTAYVVTFSGVIWGIIIFDDSHSIWIWGSLALMLVALALVTPKKKK